MREYIEAYSLTNATPLTTPTILNQDPDGDEPRGGVLDETI